MNEIRAGAAARHQSLLSAWSGSDASTLVQVNTLLRADSHFIKTLHGLPVWAPKSNP